MSGGRKGRWANGQSPSFHIQWLDHATFKVELEGQGLGDKIQDWGPWMDAQFESRFGDRHSRPRVLTAISLNFSRNDLDDDGLVAVMDYLRKRDIGVQVLKFLKNNITDKGAQAVGQFLLSSHHPVHEILLNHNYMSEKGAFVILEAIAQNRRYPFQGPGRKDAHGATPMWLRFEHNRINWSAIAPLLDDAEVRWCAAETRDGWTSKDKAPMVCMHASYINQELGAAATPHLAGSNLLAALRGQGVVDNLGDMVPQPPQQDAVEEVPMYIFLDSKATFRMMDKEDAKMFSFSGLMNLCQRSLMKCIHPQGSRAPPREGERIIFVITDSVLDELGANRNPSERRRIEWLRNSKESHLNICHNWGILEVLETTLHTQLMKLEPRHEEIARDMHIAQRDVKNFDFACLWDSQIESEGRVFFITADKVMQRFGAEIASSSEAAGGKALTVLHIDDLEEQLSADCIPGCRKLKEAAYKPTSARYCSITLSAPLLALVIAKTLAPAVLAKADAGADAHALRQELQEALALIPLARQRLLPAKADNEVARCLGKLDDAQKRWELLLS